MKKIFLLLIIALAHLVYAQEPYYINYTTDDGLPSNENYICFQDNDGFMWFATDNGLAKFDGYTFKSLNEELGIDNFPAVNALIDNNNDIWFLDFDGNNLYQKNKDTLVVYPAGKGVSIAEYPLGTIVQIPDTSILKYKDYKTQEYRDGTNISKFLEVFQKKLYSLDLRGRAYIYDESQIIDSINLNPILSKYKGYEKLVTINLCASEQYLYAIYNKLIIRIDNANNAKLFFKSSGEFDLFNITPYNDKILLSTNQGIKFLNPINGVIEKTILDKYFVRQTYFDVQNQMWVTTASNGVIMIPNLDVINYSDRDVLSTSKVNDLLVIDNKVVLAYDNGQIAIYDSLNNIKNYSLTKKPERIRRIKPINKTSFLACSDFGAYSFDLTQKNSRKIHSKSVKDGYLYKDTLYAARFRFSQIPIQTQKHANFLMKKGYAIAKGLNNDFWLGSVEGLYQFNLKNKETTVILDKSLHQNINVNHIAVAADSVIWVSTKSDGLFALKSNKVIAQFGVNNHLPSNNCNYAYPIKNGVLVATNFGVVKILNGQKVAQLTKFNGLPSNNINAVAVLNNQLYIASNKGLSIINNDQLVSTPSYDNISITKILVNDKVRATNSTSKLKAKENKISISFTGLLFEQDGETVYKYKLKEEDSTTIINNNRIDIAKLDPGDYHFKVWSLGSDDQWSNQPAEWKFKLKKPFVKTVWFWLLVGTAVLLLVYYIFKNRLKEAKNAEQLKELELQALRAQMNPHFIFNSLTSVQDLIISNKNREAEVFINQFSRLIRSVLNQSSKSKITLSEEIESLQLYINLEQLRFKDKFDYNLQIDENLDVSFEKVPPLLIQPFVENAINHGIKNKIGKGHLNVVFKKDNNDLLVTVKDDGIGRVAANQIKKQSSIHKSKGLDITQQRMNKLAKETNNIVVEDLHDSNGQPCGTFIKILLPLT